jgi:hypothetical protein
LWWEVCTWVPAVEIGKKSFKWPKCEFVSKSSAPAPKFIVVLVGVYKKCLGKQSPIYTSLLQVYFTWGIISVLIYFVSKVVTIKASK